MRFFKRISLFLYTIYYILNTPTSTYAWQDTTGETPARLQDLEYVFSRILSLAIPAAGLAAFIMLISAGFNYLTSGGDPKKTEQAKQTITFAIVGLILLVSAYIIINFIHTFTGVDVTKFVIPK